MVVKNYQTKALEAAYNREKQTIEASIAGLLVNENTNDYQTTMLYTTEEEPSSYDTTSGVYIKKYLKVSHYCGDNSGSCFAGTYSEYTDGDKVTYTPTYTGACAILKNGSSICIAPQTPIHPVRILMDLNGKKGPNIRGRDLREFEVVLPGASNLDRTSQAVNWDYKLVDVSPQCDEGVPTEKCCDITLTKACCDAFPEKYGSTEFCNPVKCSATKGSVGDN